MTMITFHHPHRAPRRLRRYQYPRAARAQPWHSFARHLHDGAKSIATLTVLYYIAAGWHHLVERLFQ